MLDFRLYVGTPALAHTSKLLESHELQSIFPTFVSGHGLFIRDYVRLQGKKPCVHHGPLNKANIDSSSHEPLMHLRESNSIHQKEGPHRFRI